MANITGMGKPTRKTVGALGDIYTDTNTGDKYKCTFAYRSNDGEEFDCEWKLIEKATVGKRNVQTKEIKEPKKDIPEPKIEKTVQKEHPVEQPKRRDYTSYSKQNN